MSTHFNPAKNLILGFRGLFPSTEFIKFIKTNQPAGYIFLGYNYDNPEQFRSCVNILRENSPESYIFSVDQEPGRVQRFKKDFPLSLAPREYVNREAFDEFREWCRSTAIMLKNVGINLNLVPVVDLIDFEKDFHVLNNRSFGFDPETVNRFSNILIDEHHKQNILTCAKHFPGLGQGDKDPHDKISISNETIEKLQEYHWRPFENVINSGVDCIMTTHLLNRNLDRENIATFSSKTIEVLKKELRFSGLILSDDLIMGGAGQDKSIELISVKALKAGHNLIMISKEIDLQRRAIYAIKDLYEKDKEFQAFLDKNDAAIEDFKKQVLND
jgi:beta-N-acetylhexosaminidase